MNWIDFLVSACLAVPAISGFRNGLVAGLLKAAGILVGLGLAVWKMPLAIGLSTSTLGISAATAPMAVFASGALAGWILGSLMGWAWKRFSEGTEIGVADRLAGLAVGLVKGTVFALVLLSLLAIGMPTVRSDLQASWTGRHALEPAVKSTRTWLESRFEAWKK